MYFSRIQLKPQVNTQHLAQALPDNIYAEHQIIWQLFSDGSHKQRDFLFRREQLVSRRPMYYTLSEQMPVDSHAVWDIQPKTFAPKLQAGQRLAFMLRANPTLSRKSMGASNKNARKHHDVVMEAKIEAEKALEVYCSKESKLPSRQIIQEAGHEWLSQKSQKHGFELVTVKADSYFQHHLHKRGEKDKPKQLIQFSTLDYEGVLEVTEPKAFIEMLFKGLGRAKGFGCGLMLVRRV